MIIVILQHVFREIQQLSWQSTSLLRMGSWVRTPAGSQKKGNQNGCLFLFQAMEYVTYILFSETLNKYYIGHTNDMVRRLAEHNRKKGKFTDAGIPWILVYSETFTDKKEAFNREMQIKNKKSRKYIEFIINNQQCAEQSIPKAFGRVLGSRPS